MGRQLTGKNKWHLLVATGGGVSLLVKRAPGTVGSLPGIGLAGALHSIFYGANILSHNPSILAAVLATTIIAGLAWAAVPSVRFAGKHFGKPDDGRIVIDEVLGQALALCLFPMTLLNICLGFALFRFFDIVKPWPIRLVDRKWKHPFGVIFDDLMAGAFAGICLGIVRSFL